MTEVLVEFPHLKDPRSGKPLWIELYLSQILVTCQ